MMHTIDTTIRIAGTPRADRESGLLPAVVYGPEIDPISVAVDYRDFERLYQNVGESSLIACQVDGQKDPVTVLIQEVQYDPVKGRMVHVDFRQIKMGEKMQATVELRFVGSSAAVRERGGTFLRGIDSVTVSCLPKDLVSHIDVDLTQIVTFDDSLSVADLVLPSGIEVMDDASISVAKVIPPLTQDQLDAMDETEQTNIEDIEVEGGDKEAGDSAENDDTKDEPTVKEEKGEEKKK